MKEKITFYVPQSWEDITIGMYNKFLQIDKKNLSPEQLGKKVIGVLCDVNYLMLNRFRTKDISLISKELLKWITKEPPKQELKKKVEFDGVEYGIIPDISTITLGEFVDLENYAKEGAKSLHKMMSVLYRPIIQEKGKMYNIELYKPNKEKEDKFLEFPILPTTSALDFFFCLGKKLQSNSHNSLKNLLEMMKEKETSVANGGGTV